MKKYFLLIQILLAAFSFYSCEYKTDEVYNRPVNRNPVPPQIQALELNIDEDTLFVYQSMDIKFKFKSDNQAIRAVRFLIDGVEMGIVESDNGTFTIWGYNVGEGLHEMSIEIYTASGSGSFADEFGAESFLSSNSWKIVVENTYDPALSKTIENGLLHISWKPFHASNFKEYIISRLDEYSQEREITRVNGTEFTDSSYVGEQTRYYISVNMQDNMAYNTGELILNGDLPRMYFTAGDSNNFRVNWTRPRYYNAVDSFIVTQSNESDYYNTTKIKFTHDINDTVCLVTEGSFGDRAHLTLRVVPKKNNIAYSAVAWSYFESLAQGSLGYQYKFPDYSPYCLRVSPDEFIYYNCDTMMRYSIPQHRAVDKLVYRDPGGCNNCFDNARISGSGEFIVSYVACSKDILFTKGSDLGRYSVHKLQAITGGIAEYMAVSDSGIAIIQNTGGGLNLYDMVTSSPVATYDKNGGDWNHPVKISPTGEYFFAGSDTLRLVRLKNGQFTTIGETNASDIRFFGFDSENANRLVLWNGSKLTVRSCEDFSSVAEFALDGDGLLDIDYAAGEILTWFTGHFYVRNLSDGSLVKDVPTVINPYNWPWNCYLVGHTIVWGGGLLYFI
jgi:hypothetical protein